MARALLHRDSNPTLKAHPKLTLRIGPYSYAVETHGTQSTYSVTDGARTISVPIRWSFGAGVQAWILEREGRYYESLVSYYPATGGLDITIGDEGLKPQNLEEAFGRLLTQNVLNDCFGCHATNAVSNGGVNFESLEPGVACERCHLGTSTHLLDAFRGEFDSAPPGLGKLSSEDLSTFCGQCHRTWETVVRNGWRGQANVRFAPYRLANSKCFDGADSRIGCLACHDPHKDVVPQESWYDSKCLACHASSPHQASATSPVAAKICPVAKSDCVSCHMPKVKLPDENVTFTDHWIRVIRAGDPYPN
jgi:Cytochrome c554 and c-prime